MRRLALIALFVLAAVGCGKKQHVIARTPPPPPPPATVAPPAPASPSSPRASARGTVPAKPAQSLNDSINELYGYASWYGHPYHGRKTASGEVYDMYQMTAAHKTLPLGTRVEVTNQSNGKQVEVRINDRGPFIEGRVIDLSYSAAREIQMIGPGIVPVSLRLLTVPDQRFGVQVGTFRELDNATRLQERLSRTHPPVRVLPLGDSYRVLVGAEATQAAAETLAAQLREEHFFGKVVVLP